MSHHKFAIYWDKSYDPTMCDESVETLGSKIRFSSILEQFSPSPPPPQTMLIFLFLRQHRLQHLHDIELGTRGIRKLTLNANKIEHLLQYRKASFSKSVSTSFLTHCSFLLCIFFQLKQEGGYIHSDTVCGFASSVIIFQKHVPVCHAATSVYRTFTVHCKIRMI